MKLVKTRNRYLWQTIFFSFVLAALTGVTFRVGMLMPLPWELSIQNVRHAHSHLMFFGWAAPLPLFILWKAVGAELDIHERGYRLMKWGLWGMLLFGLLSYPFFLVYGYHPVSVGSLSLPLSVILSGLVMVCWYIYIGGYLSARKGLREDKRNHWFEGALVMLFVCSLGAWGVAVTQAMNISNPLVGKALTHFFLACFTEGWIVLCTVALLDELLKISSDQYPFSAGTLTTMILLGAPLTFPYGISETLLTPLMLNTARAGGLTAGIGLGLIGYTMLKNRSQTSSVLLWPLILLLAKAIMQIVTSAIPSVFLLSDHALRVFYLHVLMLGAFTLTGIGHLHLEVQLEDRSFTGVAISVVLVLVSLLLLTRIWPLSWGGMWIYYAVAGAAVLPVITVTAEWIKLKTKK